MGSNYSFILKVAAVFSFLFFCFSTAYANNLKLSNFDAVSTDTSSHLMTFRFDLSQNNSWRSNTSHDAAWIFMKYSTDAGVTWHHATLSSKGVNPAGFSAPSGFELVVPPDMKGVFFRRSHAGAGDISATGVRIAWSYGLDGLSDTAAKAANTLVNLYALEMVYIPEGAFFAGDGASSSDFRFKQGSSDDQPWYITSENAITTTNAVSGGFYYQGSGSPGESAAGDIFLLPNSFPKGYQGFYLMKYELTEGEWVSFFNTLTLAARLRRDITASTDGGKNSQAVVNRNTVSWDPAAPSLPAKSLRPARAMSYISWPDAAAYAAWAALRPMTELEFEKAARGADIAAFPDEFAWGNTTSRVAGSDEIFPVYQDENGAETIFNGTANLNRNALGFSSGDGRPGGIAQGQPGPLRVGIFAENSTTRSTSGAGYYGNMELSGNMAEPVVTVGRAEGRQFLGTHGQGDLTSAAGYEGNAPNVDWPGINAQDARRGVTATKGIGYRGGDFQSSSLRAFQVSSRTFASKDPDSEGFYQRFDPGAGIFYGGRFARTAP